MAGKHDQIADTLIQDILGGHYRVNERLPSERDLAARFDANRGAVREAMKKLEQIGIAEVKPGGARVKDLNEASLDVIGHMLGRGRLPDMVLVDQILVVLDSMMGVAAEQTLELASDEEICRIRALVEPLFTGELDDEAHAEARMEVMRTIMLASRNLPLRIIARTLMEQFAPNMGALAEYANTDRMAYATFARQLDHALAKRDVQSMRGTFKAFSDLNRETVMRAFEAARADLGQEAIPR